MSGKSYNKAALIAVGAIFVLSGAAKAADAAYFASTIARYGFPQLQFLSPVIILAEMLLGLALICGIKPRWAAWTGIALTAGFTGIYLYGLLARHITDCGCFGRIAILSSSPYVVIGKNLIIIALLIYTLICKQQGDDMPRGHKALIVAMICCIALTATAYSTGMTYKKDRAYGHPASTPLCETALPELLTLSPDSTYFVFAFSYTCPHCMNSIANLRDIAEYGIADRVIGLALGSQPMAESFVEHFRPNFEVVTLDKKIFALTEKFPRGYLISGDTIRMTTTGELPCTLIFNDLAEKSLK